MNIKCFNQVNVQPPQYTQISHFPRDYELINALNRCKYFSICPESEKDRQFVSPSDPIFYSSFYVDELELEKEKEYEIKEKQIIEKYEKKIKSLNKLIAFYEDKEY